MKLPYSSYEIQATPAHPDIFVVYRPVIPFRAIGTTDSAVFYGLLDTGADETILPKAMADLIGMAVDPTQTAIATSASGDLPIAYGQVTLELPKGGVDIDGARLPELSISPGNTRFSGKQAFCTTSMRRFRGPNAK